MVKDSAVVCYWDIFRITYDIIITWPTMSWPDMDYALVKIPAEIGFSVLIFKERFSSRNPAKTFYYTIVNTLYSPFMIDIL